MSDRYQNLGLGTELLRRLIQVGKGEGVQEIVANMLPENLAMAALASRFGFKIRRLTIPGSSLRCSASEFLV